MDGRAQVEGLQAAAAGIAVGELRRGSSCRMLVSAPIGLADHEVARILERLADLLAARHFADAGVAGVVGEDDDVAGEERARARR